MTWLRLFLQPRLLIGLGIALLWGYSLWAAYAHGKAQAETKILTKVVVQKEKRDAIEKEVVALPDPDLDRRLCQWVRGGCDGE